MHQFSRKLPDAFSGTEIVLASGSRRVGTNGYLRFSLGTGNRQEAERLARRMAVEIDEFLQARKAHLKKLLAQASEDDPRGMVPQHVFDQYSPEDQARLLQIVRPVPRPTFSQMEIQQAARLMYADILRMDEQEYRKLVGSVVAQGPDGKGSEDRFLIPRENPFFVDELPPPGVDGDAALLMTLQPQIRHYLRAATGRDTFYWRLSEGYEPFATVFREAARDLRKRQSGEDVPTPPLPELAADKKPPFAWQDLLQNWLQDCERQPRTAREMQGLVQSLEMFLKGKMPADMVKHDVTAWLRHERDTRGNTGKTLEKKGTLVGALFSIAVKDDLLATNPFAGFDYKRLSQKIGIEEKTKREPFRMVHLQELFSAERLFAQTKGSGGGGYYARVWLLLLGLFTGARLDELGRLMVEDIQQDPVPHLRIRRAKNQESIRAVPLHPILLDLGFLDYVKAIRTAGHPRLWPLLRSRGALHTDSESHGRWFNRYLHQRLGFSKTLVFHSFRHTLKDLCRNGGIPREVHHQLTGHATGSVGDRYGEGFSLETLYAELSRVKLPFELPRPHPYTADRKTLETEDPGG